MSSFGMTPVTGKSRVPFPATGTIAYLTASDSGDFLSVILFLSCIYITVQRNIDRVLFIRAVYNMYMVTFCDYISITVLHGIVLH